MRPEPPRPDAPAQADGRAERASSLPALSLLTLNLARAPHRRVPAIVGYLAERPEDVLVLTEVGGSGASLLTTLCRRAGYQVVGPAAGEDLGVLVVGRAVHLEPSGVPRPAVLPGRVEAVRVVTDAGAWRVAGVYGAASDPVRYASAHQRARKRAWLTAFDAWLAGWCASGAEPGVVLGDLNIVDPVHTDRLPYVLAEERDAYVGLTAEHDLTDAWRLTHPDAAAVSWVDHSGAGCRYDHAFVTADLATAVLSCELDDTPRTSGLSDHSALALELARPRQGDPG